MTFIKNEYKVIHVNLIEQYLFISTKFNLTKKKLQILETIFTGLK